MKMAFKVGLMDEEETVKTLEMIDLRIKSEHACQEKAVEEIYWQVRDYWKLMDEVCRRVVERVESGFPGNQAEK